MIIGPVRSVSLAALLSLVLALPGWAQEGDTDLSEEEAAEELGTEAAEPPPSGRVEEIVVTITKREQRVQDIPGSVTGFTSSQIQQANIQNIGDLVSLIPNATVKGQGAGPISIRGISQSFSSQSPISNHLNGVFVFNEQILGAMFYDLQGIDVARGPSGTIYGRNATAGALNLVWQKPKDQFEVFGDVTFGNYERLDFRGGVNIPMFGNDDDRLMTRFVFQRLDHDGYVNNLETDGQNHDPAGVDTWHVRGALEANPREDTRFELRGFFTTNKCCVAASRSWQPYPDMGAIDLGGTILPTFPYRDAKPLSPDRRETRSRAFELADPGGNWYGFDGQISYDIADTPDWLGEIELALLGGMQFGDNNDISDADASEISLLDTLRADENRNGTFELRAVSSGAEWANWIVGLFYFNQHLDRLQTTRATINLSPNPAVPSIASTLLATREATNWGVAPYLSVNITPPSVDWLEIFGGFRWNQDEVKVDAENLPSALRPASQLSGSESFGEPTGEFGLKGTWGDGNVVYAKYSRGYKAGNIELLADGSVNAVQPETVDAVEAGTKNQFFDNRLLLNLTGFWYGYDNLQVPSIQGLEINTKNAAEATIWGIELETTIVPVDDWTIIATASYLNAEFNEFCTNDAAQFLDFDECPVPTAPTPGKIDGNIDLSGNKLEDSPEWKITLLTNYRWDLGRWGVVTPVLKFTWSDSYFLRPFNCGQCLTANGIDFQKGFTRTDLRLQWRSQSDLLFVEAFIENIEDSGIYSRVIVGSQVNGGTAARFGFQTPRIYGMRFGISWEGL